MKVSPLFVVVAFVLLQYNLAFKTLKFNRTLADEEVRGNHDFGKVVYVEARKLTNKQIAKKFKMAWNREKTMLGRVKAAENKIASLKKNQDTLVDEIASLATNQETIQHSLRIKCYKIDELLDTGDTSTTQDCCLSGFYVLCLSRDTTSGITDFVKDPAGSCDVCPDALTPSLEELEGLGKY